MAGDYVQMKLELLVLPRAGADYSKAMANTNSRTLSDLQEKSTSERVRAQAIGGQLNVIAGLNARVDAHYPVRIYATQPGNVTFEVQSYADADGVHYPLGYVPVIITGLTTHSLPAGSGLWLRPSDAAKYTLMSQGSGNEFWQTNFDRAAGAPLPLKNVVPLSCGALIMWCP